MSEIDKHVLDAELGRRLEEYVDIVRPGHPDSRVPPLTAMQYLPAVVISIGLTVAAILMGIWGIS